MGRKLEICLLKKQAEKVRGNVLQTVSNFQHFFCYNITLMKNTETSKPTTWLKIEIYSVKCVQKYLNTKLTITRWFKYNRDKLWLVYIQIVPVIFKPPCTIAKIGKINKFLLGCLHFAPITFQMKLVQTWRTVSVTTVDIPHDVVV